MRATRITLKNWMGIESKAFDIGEGGVLIKGKNRSGKTSIMQAFVSALTGAGIDPDHIRAGADKTEILIDFTDPVAQVRRIGRRSGNHGLETDGLGLGKQQARLNEILGPSISPMALLNAKPVDRRKIILEAMPATVTAEDLLRWTGDKWEPDPARHGLEVIADVRKHYYELRTKANADAKEAQRKHEEARAKANSLASPAHVGVLMPLPGEEEKPVEAAHAALTALNQRRLQAAEQEQKAAGTRAKIAEMCAQAIEEDGKRGTQLEKADLEALNANLNETDARVRELEAELQAWKVARQEASDALNAAVTRNREWNESEASSRTLRSRADELEASLTSSAIAAPSDPEMEAARAEVVRAEKEAELVRSARAAHDALAEAAALGDDATDAVAEADRLNAIVTRLTDAAPAEIAARSASIKGLTFTENGGIALDGVALDLLSGQEAIDFCVQVAKRAHPKCKLLTVDKLEQLDPESLEAFIRSATADGWQLVGTRVQAGELVIELLEAA